jgi:hypothetical protein
MRHRSYRGKMLYLTDGIGEMGREYFSVTIQPDGSRTLRAQCEMDDDRLLRDVTLTVDARWRPIDAFVRLSILERSVGSTWFHFEGSVARCHGWTAQRGLFEQRLEFPQGIECFGTHALHGDSWVLARLRAHTGPPEALELATCATSTLANGGSGPELVSLSPGFAQLRDLGVSQVRVPAGEFACRGVRVLAPGVDDFDVWAGGEDCLPVRLLSRGLHQTYELVEIEGDYR